MSFMINVFVTIKKKHLMYISVQVPSGKGENNFAFDGEVQDKQFAKEVPV